MTTFAVVLQEISTPVPSGSADVHSVAFGLSSGKAGRRDCNAFALRKSVESLLSVTGPTHKEHQTAWVAFALAIALRYLEAELDNVPVPAVKKWRLIPHNAAHLISVLHRPPILDQIRIFLGEDHDYTNDIILQHVLLAIPLPGVVVVSEPDGPAVPPDVGTDHVKIPSHLLEQLAIAWFRKAQDETSGAFTQPTPSAPATNDSDDEEYQPPGDAGAGMTGLLRQRFQRALTVLVPYSMRSGGRRKVVPSPVVTTRVIASADMPPQNAVAIPSESSAFSRWIRQQAPLAKPQPKPAQAQPAQLPQAQPTQQPPPQAQPIQQPPPPQAQPNPTQHARQPPQAIAVKQKTRKPKRKRDALEVEQDQDRPPTRKRKLLESIPPTPAPADKPHRPHQHHRQRHQHHHHHHNSHRHISGPHHHDNRHRHSPGPRHDHDDHRNHHHDSPGPNPYIDRHGNRDRNVY